MKSKRSRESGGRATTGTSEGTEINAKGTASLLFSAHVRILNAVQFGAVLLSLCLALPLALPLALSLCLSLLMH